MSEAQPIHFFRLHLTEQAILSQKPPHHDAISIINFQLVVRYFTTSEERIIFCISLDAVLHVLALSDHTADGNYIIFFFLQNDGRPRRMTQLKVDQ